MVTKGFSMDSRTDAGSRIFSAAIPHPRLSYLFDHFIIILIVLSSAAVMLESMQGVMEEYGIYLVWFEHFAAYVFTIEYILRVWHCTALPAQGHPVLGRLRYMTTPLALIDLFAILPFYLPLIFPMDLIYVRALRLFRFVRVLKLGRYSQSFQLLGDVIRKKREDLIVVLAVIGVILFVASSMMYFVEHGAQPERFSSIPVTLWWGLTTLASNGAGEMAPGTVLGKGLTVVIQLLGLGFAALPAGIVASGFIEEFQRKKAAPMVCPHCGKEISGQVQHPGGPGRSL